MRLIIHRRPCRLLLKLIFLCTCIAILAAGIFFFLLFKSNNSVSCKYSELMGNDLNALQSGFSDKNSFIDSSLLFAVYHKYFSPKKNYGEIQQRLLSCFVSGDHSRPINDRGSIFKKLNGEFNLGLNSSGEKNLMRLALLMPPFIPEHHPEFPKAGTQPFTPAWPLPGEYGRDSISSDNAGRVNPITGIWENSHGAIDVAAPKSTPIYAAAQGTVLLSGWHESYGNFVKIDHGGGIATLYAHQSKLNCTKGQKVKRGQLIGYVGSTGDSTGNHLHFEVRENEERVNPLSYFGN